MKRHQKYPLSVRRIFSSAKPPTTKHVNTAIARAIMRVISLSLWDFVLIYVRPVP